MIKTAPSNLDLAGAAGETASWGPEPERIATVAVWIAVALCLGTALTQVLDYGAFDLRYRALDSNTHRSIFGAVSLLASATAVGAAFLLAARERTTERLLLCGGLVALLLLRVAWPTHVVVLSIPFDCVVLVILWRQGGPRSGPEAWLLRAGCLLLVLSFLVHVAERSSLSIMQLNAHSWAYQLRCVVKHDAELAAWVLIAAGLLCAWKRAARPRSSSAPA